MNLFLYVVYRSPSVLRSSFLSEFENFLFETEVTDRNTLYVGDFNIWMEDENNVDTINFLDILDNFNLINHVTVPTFESGHVLDLIITRKFSLVTGVLVDNVCTISDHRLVTAKLNFDSDPKITKKISFRNKNRVNSSEFSDILKSLPLHGEMRCEHSGCEMPCTDCLIEIYKSKTSDFFNTNFPLIEKCIKVQDSNNLWYNSDIKKAKRELRKAEKLFLRHKTDFYREKFKELQQFKCKLVAKTKISFYTGKIGECKNDSKELFRVLNGLLGKSKSFILPQCHSDEVLANRFRDFFLKKIDDITSSFDPNFSGKKFSLIPDYPLRKFESFDSVCINEIYKILRKTNKTFCDNDPFDLKIFDFEEVSGPLASYFCAIVNSSFGSGIFPESEKFSLVRPLLKGQSDPEILSSYRPLYNTSFLSKILESAALSQILSHLGKFQSFPKVQSAYREFHSVETAMTKIYNDLIIRKCEGKCSLLVLLDLSAAFDTIDHGMLLNDLEILGIGGKVLQWFSSYLENRSFCVKIGNEFSNRGVMKTGIPQGSVLGPVLFIVYTIELYYLLESLEVICHFYADDTQFYFTVENMSEGIEKFEDVYMAIESWMKSRKLKLNSGKTEIMLVGSSARLAIFSDFHEIKIGDSVVKLSNQVRSLGVIIDENLTLRQQINNTKKKAIFALINIARISKFIDESSRLKLVNGLVFSVLDYCNSLYYGLPAFLLHPMQVIINSAARLVVGMPYFSRDRITPICIKLHFLPFKARIVYKICLLTYKAINFGEPQYISELFKIHVPNFNMNLRNFDEERLEEPFISRSVKVQRSFRHSAPRLFNSLPVSVRRSETLAIFKKNLKTFLFTKAYDVLSETISPDFSV